MSKKLSNKQKGLMVVMCVATSAMLTACVNDNNTDEKGKDVSTYSNSKSIESTKTTAASIKEEKEPTTTEVAKAEPKITKLAAKTKRSSKSAKVSKTKTKVVKKSAKKTKSTKKAKPIKKVKKRGNFMSRQDLNIRFAPGINGKKKGVLKTGVKAQAMYQTKVKGVTWYQVKTSNKIGWVSAAYLTKYKKMPKYKPNTINYGKRSVPYKNTGMTQVGGVLAAQKVIDKTKCASTFGGTRVFNGNDGKNTHFVGHKHKQFVDIHKYKTFVVTDSKGRAYTYKRTNLYVVDARGVNVVTGKSKWDRITGVKGGERIVLQSTKTHPQKWIIEAELVK